MANSIEKRSDRDTNDGSRKEQVRLINEAYKLISLGEQIKTIVTEPDLSPLKDTLFGSHISGIGSSSLGEAAKLIQASMDVAIARGDGNINEAKGAAQGLCWGENTTILTVNNLEHKAFYVSEFVTNSDGTKNIIGQARVPYPGTEPILQFPSLSNLIRRLVKINLKCP